MLNADKYINRLRIIIKSTDAMKINKGYKPRLEFVTNRIVDIITDYDKDFDRAMEEMEKKNV